MNRKHHPRMWSLPAIIRRIPVVVSLLLFQSIVSNKTLAQGDSPERLSYREREIQAFEQLRAYRHRIERAVARPMAPDRSTQSVEATEAGIRLNPTIETSSTIFFQDDMESGVNGWTTATYNGTALWARTTMRWSSPTHSWWFGNEGQGNYDLGRVSTALLSPPIDLTGAVAPIQLLFVESYMTELGWDFCLVDVQVVGEATWTHLRGGYGSAPSGDSRGWTIATLDLSAFAGKTIVVRFYFETGDHHFNAFPGWFIDDVVVFDQGGTITGKKFFDVNNNSLKDPGERGVKDWLITATGPITLTTRTNYRGRYQLPLPLGTYTVSETHQPNWTQTYPLSGSWNITLSVPDTLVDSIHFGNYIHASFINGRKFNDINENGVYDTGDSVIAEWKIVLADTNGKEVDFDRTDSLGEYSLYVFSPGRYVVREVTKKGWIQSHPPSETYTIDIPDLSTVSEGNDFGNYFSPQTNSIYGLTYHDRNRNGLLEEGETGVAGFTIQLLRKGSGNRYSNYRQRTTDSSGFYQFLSIPPDTYLVRERPLQGWWQSAPESSHIVVIVSGIQLDSLDFGNYQISPGVVSGMKYNDLNGDGVQDEGEDGLPGWRIELSGTSYYGATINQALTTDQDGRFAFNTVWPGSYSVSEVFRTHWRQTQPVAFQPYFITLQPETNLDGLKFGNTADSNFHLGFRTFLPESLAQAKDRKRKYKPIPLIPDKIDFAVEVVVDTENVGAIDIFFGQALIADDPNLPVFTDPPSASGVSINPGKNTHWKFSFTPPLTRGQVLTISGITRKPKAQYVKKYYWTLGDGVDRTPARTDGARFIRHDYKLPLPNALNVLQEAGNRLRVGLGGAHSVVHATYKDIHRSLIETKLERMHIGEPRCLGTFGNRASIKREQRYLKPTKHNNKLLAEAIALKTNITASDLGITPGGFGNLIYDDGSGSGNPLNNLSIREVAARLDSFMTAFNETTKTCRGLPSLGSLDSVGIWTIVRNINSAFSGPMDTISFASGLQLTEVRSLNDIPFLRFDPVAANRWFIPGDYNAAAIPERSELFQNFPNPFNPSTTIEFYLNQPSLVTVRVFNAIGQEVARILDREEMDDGSQQIEFDASGFPSGVYFYRLVAEGIPGMDEDVRLESFAAVRKMVLIR